MMRKVTSDLIVVVKNFLLIGTPSRVSPQRVWWPAINDGK